MAADIIPQRVAFNTRKYVRGPWPDSETVWSNSSSYRSWQDSVDRSAENPGWRRAIRNGQQAGTALTVFSQECVPMSISASGSIRFLLQDMGEKPDIFGEDLAGISGGFDPYTGISCPYPSETAANNEALGAFMQKATRAQRQVQGLVIAGESAKTLRLLRSPLRSFRGSLQTYIEYVRKRIRRIRKRDRRGFLGDTWLEYAFGWTPLVNDIDDAMHALADVNAGVSRSPLKVIHARGSDENSALNSKWITLTANGQHYSIRGKRRRKRKAEVRYLGAVSVDKVPSFTPRYLGLGLRDFLPTAWELVPYSFLVDYFVNVDNIIDAVSFRRSDLRWVMKWTVSEDIHSFTNLRNFTTDTYNPDRMYSTFSVSTPGYLNTFQLSRGPYVGSLIPGLEFSLPGSGSRKWLNIAGLSLARLRW